MAVRPTPDQVLSLAPDRAAATAALPVGNPASWSAAGCDDVAVWGQYVATSAEPYNVAVDLSDDANGPAYRCNCPSRKIPCKHTLGLLLLYANDAVAPARRLPFAADWLQRRQAARRDEAPDDADAPVDPPVDMVSPAGDGDDSVEAGGALGGGARAPREPMPPVDPQRLKRQMERADRMRAGLVELDRWLADRIRVGLASAELSDPATWDRLAARLVDAQCGSLANRVKRVATKVGQHARWHEDVLEEMALLHALAVGAQHTSTLDQGLADGVHVATGLTVAKDDVLAGVPSTARWIVAGESRTREDRITVQRTWLASDGDGPVTWAMLLAFGTFGNEVSSDHSIGAAFTADLHWYPGGIALRAIIGRMHSEPGPATRGPAATSVADAVGAFGWAIAREPWLERYPMSIRATPAPLGHGRWAMADATGCVLIVAGFARLAEIVCISGGAPIDLVGEYSIDGFLPLTMFTLGGAVAL